MSTPIDDAEVTALPSLPGLPSGAREIRRARDGLMARLFGDVAPPVTWGRYELRRRVGAGGMGVVYAVWDPQLGREVALKVISANAAAAVGPELPLARLAREAQAMARINHPNVVPVYDVGRDADQLYFAMELVHGASLDRWLAQSRRSLEAILDVFDQIAAGVAAAHQVGLLHRDLKPQNVLVGDDGRVRVADFGLARAVASSGASVSQTDEHWSVASTISATDAAVTVPPDLTGTGAAVGTPAYMSPEQHAGTPLDERTDVYAWSVALFVAVYGVLPFEGVGAMNLFVRKTDGAIAWPARHRPVPRWLVAVLERGMQASPERRFAGMPEVRAALRRGRGAPARRRAAVLGVAAVTIGGAVALGQGRGAAQRCDGAGDDPIAAVWNEQRAADLEGAFTRASPIGAVQFVAAAPGLHAWADEWTDTHRRSCEQANGGDTAAGDLDDRSRCLDDALTGFTAALDRFERADAGVVERAVDLVARLGHPARCLDATAEVHDDATAANPRTTLLLERLAQLEIERLAGRIFAHADELVGLAAEADAIGDPGLRVRAHLLLAHARRAGGDLEGSIPELELAHAIAIAEGMGMQQEEAAHSLAVVLGKHLRRSDEALRWIEIAAAVVERYHLPVEKRALLESDHGGVLLAANDVDAAIVHQLRAVALAESVPSGRTRELTVAVTLNELGVAQARQGDHEVTLATRERAVAAFDDAVGPEHPLSSVARANLASTLRDVGRPDEAEPILVQCLDALEHVYGPHERRVVMIANELGALRGEVLADPDGAIEAYAIAYAGVRTLTGPANLRLRAGVMGNYGDALWFVGRYAEALELHRLALAGDEEHFGSDHEEVVNDVLRVGYDTLALGMDDEARSALQRARTLAERRGNRSVSARAELALAWLSRRSDVAAARRSAVAALGHLDADSSDHVLVAEWIADLDGEAPLPADWRQRARVQRLPVVP